MIWQLSDRADPEARRIADRHYNRQKPGTPQFVPPGRCLVLKALVPSGSRLGPSLSTLSTDGPGRGCALRFGARVARSLPR